jgi:predicted acyl esterase
MISMGDGVHLHSKTPPLHHDVAVAGELMADLFASTSGTDSDWIVKLIDVYQHPSSAVAYRSARA